MNNEFTKYVIDYNVPPDDNNENIWSVKYSNFRVEEAKRQLGKQVVDLERIKKYANEFLNGLGFDTIDNPKFEMGWLKDDDKRAVDEFYKKIQDNFDLTYDSDIVFMRFTLDGYIGVVGNNKDAHNFADDTTSSIIISKLAKSWNKDFVYIFPLKKLWTIKDWDLGDCRCHRVEKGIGNYLSEKYNVPILDYFSHRFKPERLKFKNK